MSISLRHMVLATLFLFMNIVGPQESGASQTNSNLKNGPQTELDLPLSLDGDWLFVWDEFLDPETAVETYRSGNLETVQVPADWREYLADDKENPYRHGKASYLIRSTLPIAIREDLVMHVELIPDAYRIIWVPMSEPQNWIEITQQGNLEGEPLPAVRGLSHPLPVSGDGLFLFHVRKDLLSWGGILSAPVLKPAKVAVVEHRLGMLGDGLWIGALAVIALFNAIRFFAADREPASLLLALAATGLAVRGLVVADYLEMAWGTDWHVVRYKIELFCIPVLSATILALNQVLFAGSVHRFICRIIYVTAAALLAFILVAPIDLSSSSLPVIQLHLLTALVLSLWSIVSAARSGQSEGRMLGIAGLLGILSGIHDIFSANIVGYDVTLSEYTLFAVFLCYSLLISKRANEAATRARLLEVEKEKLARLHSDAVETARQDHLTGLLNRQVFDQTLEVAWQQSIQSDTSVAVILFDIDHFKTINDTHGHIVGDRALVALADRLRNFDFRNTDVVCRYGGEEFVIILPGTKLADAASLAERLRAAISASPILDKDPTLPLTCSFGVAARNISNATSASALVSEADDALYVAKRTGRNRVYSASLGDFSAKSNAA